MSINEVRWLSECGSTNAYAKEHFEEFGPVGAVYTTNQTAGRGRLGRSWVNAEGRALYYTAVIREPLAQPATLPLLASLAVRRQLQLRYGVDCQIKWPNDLLLNGKKVVGILCESVSYGYQQQGRGILCGIGINLAQPQSYFDAANLPNGTSQLVEKASILDFMEYYQVTLMNPTVLIGIFIGAMMSFLFCGLTMNAVGRAAESMVNEVRRQFREIKGILTGEGTPDYARCVEISTRGAQREMMFPSLLAIVVPLAVGLVFGVAGVMGLLVGGLSSGFVLAVFMANAGGAWDNAKKMVEEGHFGGKGSDCHRATVVGDTVGDPFKDTSGPSLNILIKLMSMVAIVMAGLTVAFHLF